MAWEGSTRRVRLPKGWPRIQQRIAYTWYEERDRPHITPFGVTVEQRVWLGTAEQLIG